MGVVAVTEKRRATELECTNSDCDRTAEAIIAWPMVGEAVYVAPYCKHHAEQTKTYQGGTFACGPALSAKAQRIDGTKHW